MSRSATAAQSTQHLQKLQRGLELWNFGNRHIIASYLHLTLNPMYSALSLLFIIYVYIFHFLYAIFQCVHIYTSICMQFINRQPNKLTSHSVFELPTLHLFSFILFTNQQGTYAGLYLSLWSFLALSFHTDV